MGEERRSCLSSDRGADTSQWTRSLPLLSVEAAPGGGATVDKALLVRCGHSSGAQRADGTAVSACGVHCDQVYGSCGRCRPQSWWRTRRSGIGDGETIVCRLPSATSADPQLSPAQPFPCPPTLPVSHRVQRRGRMSRTRPPRPCPSSLPSSPHRPCTRPARLPLVLHRRQRRSTPSRLPQLLAQAPCSPSPSGANIFQPPLSPSPV